MNFFEHQTKAKKNSTRLVFLFIVAIICIIAALYLVAIGINHLIQTKLKASSLQELEVAFSWWQPYIFAGVAGGVLAIIGVGSLYKIWRLSQGGSAVALELGARCVPSNTTDPDERRLLNVVEEMAIASGVPVPLVYVMDDEAGINAFAAGYSPNDAAIAVTAGCLKVMKRDELQGIIAHEFSHIFNGDMRLNIRLIGLIHGILIIYVIGLTVMRGVLHSRGGGSRKGGGGIIVVLAAGAAMAIVGSLGVFFGRLIKAGISREREYLADASAVDFTRNPDGIAHALIKIGGYGASSRIDSAQGETVSHMLFGDWRVKGFQTSSLLSTHPPLLKRIERVYPAFDGQFPEIPMITVRKRGDRPAPTTAAAAMASPFAVAVVAAAPGDVIQRVGTLDPAQLAYGAALIAAIPEDYRRSARDPARSVCLVYALLLDDDEKERDRQCQLLEGKIKPALRDEMMRLFGMRSKLRASARLPLLEMAMPALRQLSHKQREVFLDQVQTLVEADKRTTIFEFALTNLLRRSLLLSNDPKRKEARYYAFNPIRNSCLHVLSALSHIGAEDKDHACAAFLAGARKLPSSGAPLREPLPAEACGFSRMGEALDQLAQASPVLKERIIDAFAHCVLRDGKVTVEEAELLRAVCATMDCPMPPFLPKAEEKSPEA